MSPRTPADNVPLSASTEGAPDSPLTADGASTTKEPASGPQRTRASSNAAKGGDREPREKRKRSRVTPEQLTHLERFFVADRSPTAARRKEISELLGMQERQTQIWFQNRSVAERVLSWLSYSHFSFQAGEGEAARWQEAAPRGLVGHASRHAPSAERRIRGRPAQSHPRGPT